MNWHSDPTKPWVAVYRVLVLLALIGALWLQLDTRRVYDPIVDGLLATPTP